MESQSTIGLIAGKSQFPSLVIQGIHQAGHNVVAVGFKGHTQDNISRLSNSFLWLQIGQLGKMIRFFKRLSVRYIIFAGGINKPRVIDLRPDFKAAKLLFQTHSKSDNNVLQLLVQTLEKEGFQIISPFEFIPELKTPSGILTHRSPTVQENKDIEFGWPLAKRFGSMDIGQCLVIKKQIVVAVEAIEGTDSTIKRAGELVGQDCVVLKIFKPGQEEHVDQPAIGKETIETMIQAKASCLAIESGKSLFFDRDQSIQMANQAGISIVGYH